MIQIREEGYEYVVQLVSSGKINRADIKEEVATELMNQDMFCLDSDELRMKPQFPLVFSTIANWELLLQICVGGESEKEVVSFFTNKETIVYVRKYDGIYQIKWLPHIPMLVGGVSSTLKRIYEQKESVNIQGVVREQEKPDFELLLDEVPIDRENIVQRISAWFAESYSKQLKERSQR